MKRYLQAGRVGMALCLAANSVWAQAPERIRFARNATSAVVKGVLRGFESEKMYVLRVLEGQTMTIKQLENDTRLITLMVIDPSGEYVGDSDASCNRTKRITPTMAGDYKIRVLECRKAEPWRGTFHLKVKVI